MTAKFCPLNLTPEEIIEYTPEWEGDRSEDGRPRVADEILERMRQRVPGVSKVKADHGKSQVTVHYKGDSPDMDVVKQTITDLGYEVQ